MRVYVILLSVLLALNILVSIWTMRRLSRVLDAFHAAGDVVDEVRKTSVAVQKLRETLGPLFGGGGGGAHADNPPILMNAAANVFKSWK